MGLWIPFTIFAAFMQSWRNAFQSRLSQDLSAAGVTLARFIWAGPMAAVYLVILYLWQPGESVAREIPNFPPLFPVYIVLASIAQIFATALMVKLFQLRNYAIGVGLAKSEAVIAATLGALFFGAPLSMLAWSGVFVGGVAVWLMSVTGQIRDLSWQTVLTGLGSGLGFALTTLWVREAALVLGLPFPYGAAWVLLWVIALQTAILLIWLLWRDPGVLAGLWARSRFVLMISLCSCLGSIGWFTAMSLETVALVKTLGQIEIIFTLLISAKWFGDKLQWRERCGLLLIVVGAVCVIVA